MIDPLHLWVISVEQLRRDLGIEPVNHAVVNHDPLGVAAAWRSVGNDVVRFTLILLFVVADCLQ